MASPDSIQKEIDKIDAEIAKEEAKVPPDPDVIARLKREKEIKQLEKRIAILDEAIGSLQRSIEKHAGQDIVPGLEAKLKEKETQRGDLQKELSKKKKEHRIKELEKKIADLTADDPDKNKKEIDKAQKEIEKLKEEIKALG